MHALNGQKCCCGVPQIVEAVMSDTGPSKKILKTVRHCWRIKGVSVSSYEDKIVDGYPAALTRERRRLPGCTGEHSLLELHRLVFG